MNNDEETTITETNPDALEAALGDDFIDYDDDGYVVVTKKKSDDDEDGDSEDEDGIIVAFADDDNPFDLI